MLSHPSKISPSHLRRSALIYIRQSTMRQVLENTESTERQYALRQQAEALGWEAQNIHVIDQDLGQSGVSAADRAGFQALVAEVSLGHVGLVVGLEVSRLARNSADWHQLLELCALTGTLIYDEDGLYDPKEFNDRLVLGLKGTMSEAELHVLKSRLQGGLRSKALRGELKIGLPVGLVYQADNRVALDPDQAIQAAVHLVFETFSRTGSAWKTVRYFMLHHLTFPRQLRYGPHKGEVVWGALNHNRVRKLLHNPRYAGAFCYGRTHVRYTGDHKVHIEPVPLAEWLVLIPDAHPGYITWEQYQHNQEVLRANAQTFDAEDGSRPPREGSALLQGLVLCGRCGQRMMTHYRLHRGQQIPEYVCEHERVKGTTPLCQYVPGRAIDAAVGTLVVDLISPAALQMVLAVQEEFGQQGAQRDQLPRQTIERARYESDLAHRRYLQVDPENRLVAVTLEHDWNDKLQTLQDLEHAYARGLTEDPRLSATDQAAVAALATDIPRIWADPATPMRERKRLVRLVMADVTLLRDETAIHVGIRLRSGHTRTLDLPRPQTLADQRRIPAETIARIDALLDTHTDGEVAQALNAEGIRPSLAESFTPVIVRYVRRTYHLPSRKQRLLQQGWLTPDAVAATLHISKYTVQSWRLQGILRAALYSDHHQYLYDPLTYALALPEGRHLGRDATGTPVAKYAREEFSPNSAPKEDV